MKKRSECIRNLSLTLLVAVTLVGYSASGTSGGASESQSSKSEDAETIEFAVMGSTTGGMAGLGQQQEYGVRLAVQEINESGRASGKKLVYDAYDNQMNINQVVTCTEKTVAANKYRFVVTSISTGCSKAAYPTWANADPPVLSGINTGNTIMELGYKNYLRICAKDSAIIEQMCDYMVNECGVKKPAILYTSADTDVTNFDFIKDYLKDKCDIDIIDSAQVQVETEKDYTTYITNFKGKDTDAVYPPTEYNPVGLSLKQKASLGQDIQVFRSTGCADLPIFQVADAKCMEGLITMSVLDAESINERVRRFVKSYTELTGVNPGQEAAGPYDLIYMVSEALKNEETSGLNSNALMGRFRSNTSYSGIMVDVEGPDANGGNPNAKPYMLIAKNGTYVGIDEKQKEIKGER